MPERQRETPWGAAGSLPLQRGAAGQAGWAASPSRPGQGRAALAASVKPPGASGRGAPPAPAARVAGRVPGGRRGFAPPPVRQRLLTRRRGHLTPTATGHGRARLPPFGGLRAAVERAPAGRRSSAAQAVPAGEEAPFAAGSAPRPAAGALRYPACGASRGPGPAAPAAGTRGHGASETHGTEFIERCSVTGMGSGDYSPRVKQC